MLTNKVQLELGLVQTRVFKLKYERQSESCAGWGFLHGEWRLSFNWLVKKHRYNNIEALNIILLDRITISHHALSVSSSSLKDGITKTVSYL